MPPQTIIHHPSAIAQSSNLLVAAQPMQSMQGMEGMSMDSANAGNRMTAPGTLLGVSMLIAGAVIMAGAVLTRRKRVDQDATQPAKRSFFSSKNTLALGVFAVLAGSTLAVTSLVRPPSMMSMEGMEGMSMEEMMRVDGSSNPMPVTIETIQPRLLEARVRYTGSIKAYQEVTVYPRVEGQLTEYSVYPGDRIQAGQVLAQLSAAERTTDVAEAIAETQVSRSEMQVARAEIAEQQQEIQRMAADYTYWQKELPRAQALLQKGVISQDEYDKERSQADAAKAALQGAKTKLVRMQAQVDAAESKLAQAMVKSRRAAILESYKTVTAPMTGIVQERMVDPGVFVQPGMGILKIGDYSRVRLQANVAQQDAVKIQVGSAITARVPGKSTEMIKGKVTSLFPKVGEETRTVTVEAIVENPNGRLVAGQFLEMSIITDLSSGALSVPQSAIAEFNSKPVVWVMAGAVAQRRMITTGITNSDRVEVTNGLKSGDQVIITGQERLVENMRVAAVDVTGKSVASLNNANQGNVRIQMISPKDKAVMGDNQLILEVQDPNTGNLMPVKNLEVEAAMPMKNMAPMKGEVEVKPGNQPGRFEVSTYFGMRGSWQVNAKVKDGENQGQKTFTLEAR